MCFDLFLAGQETTATTLVWGFAYLLHNPEVQKKVHDELDRVIGSDRLITMDDKNSLPYLNAVIAETHRTCNLMPQNFLHRTTREVVVDGYNLPAGTCIIPQMTGLHYDDRIFPDPTMFDPTRFLDANGSLKRVDELIPFSIGKRQCAGEGLARMEMFLFTANLLNQFRFSAGSELPSTKRRFAVAVFCEPYRCRAEARH
ncbi:Protein CYP-33C1 [Aphelenchoides avenae]|nr:Protein CYP-33C1 [Aphelenchus avenae]